MGDTHGNIWEITHLELVFRMILAVVLGGSIGIEREWSNHAAGFRTHILVCLGSTTIMLLSIYGFSQFVYETNVRVDPARLAAQVISGIGFLGAGAIMRNGNMVKGLTTAASVWVVAGIGLCVGAGFYMGAILSTCLVLISLYVLNKWEKHMLLHRRPQQVELEILDYPGALGRIASAFGEHEIQIANVTMRQGDESVGENDMPTMYISFSLKLNKQEKLLAACEGISKMDFVLSMEAATFQMLRKQIMNSQGGSLSI
ncbi:MgtC/SapB family protein [Paenibacillus whitsoniae]|uniref:MgtC/SapB family protein n=1 Tax=Paenibacillus whitsoniae TaxID=2496558 RepID=A0A3S0CX50_9BACL|nr:MgtC/SapB family protein [Paenibacillus whitsoniae]RTE10772.1 MgtC/SapB family protein [Paenibacillus whitsoniae]